MSSTITTVTPGPLQNVGAALSERLHLVFPSTRFEHKFMPPRLSRDEWRRLLNRTPFVGLGWSDIDPIRDNVPNFIGESHWSVFLVTKNQAGARQLYFGDNQGPGLFQMVHAAIAILHGFTITGVGQVKVTKGGNAFAEGWDVDDMALAVVDVAVGTTIAMADTLAGIETDAWTKLGIDWNFLGDGQTGNPEISDVVETT